MLDPPFLFDKTQDINNITLVLFQKWKWYGFVHLKEKYDMSFKILCFYFAYFHELSKGHQKNCELLSHWMSVDMSISL